MYHSMYLNTEFIVVSSIDFRVLGTTHSPVFKVNNFETKSLSFEYWRTSCMDHSWLIVGNWTYVQSLLLIPTLNFDLIFHFYLQDTQLLRSSGFVQDSKNGTERANFRSRNYYFSEVS